MRWKEQIEMYYTKQLTDFLDPRERQIIRSVIGESNDDIRVSFLGGDKEAERKRALIAPFYEEHKIDDYELVLYQANFAKKFININHGDVIREFLVLCIERIKMR